MQKLIGPSRNGFLIFVHVHVLTEKVEIFASSLSMSINPSSELYSEELTEDAADVDSLYQQLVSSNP